MNELACVFFVGVLAYATYNLAVYYHNRLLETEDQKPASLVVLWWLAAAIGIAGIVITNLAIGL